MEYREGVPHLDLEVGDDVKECAGTIAAAICPGWNKEQIVVEDKSSGYINRNYLCYAACRDDAILIRIVNTRMPGHLEKAIDNMRYLKRAKLGAQLLLTFNNGLVMEFIEGEVVTWDCIAKIKEHDVWLAYAREMAKFHAKTNFDDAKKFNILNHDASSIRYRAVIDRAVASGKIPNEALVGLPTTAEITDWGKVIYQQLLDAGAETRFCHMDANPTNVIIRPDRSVAIVDYDDCILELPCLEISGAFGSLGGLLDFNPANMPTEKQQDQFLREYLETRRQYEPERGPVTEKLVDYWKFLLRKSQLRGMLTAVGIIIMLQNVSDKPVDMNLAHVFYKMYQERKEEIMAETFSWNE